MRWPRSRRGGCGKTRQAPGYWLTDYTSSPRYAAPQKEMNTYLTSILVDLLAPVAPKLGLADVVARAKRELAAQIESNGLVRYHGLPNAPTIGTLGCVITPDADDTALVWRIAGPGAGDPRLQRMLRTLARYRDGRGLYRTWLAPQNRYQCLDPGRDPDPADIAIQMHVYLMLRRVRSAGGAGPLQGDSALVGQRRRLGLLREDGAGAVPPQRRTGAARVPGSAPDGATGATRPGTGVVERGGATARADRRVGAGRERAPGDP